MQSPDLLFPENMIVLFNSNSIPSEVSIYPDRFNIPVNISESVNQVLDKWMGRSTEVRLNLQNGRLDFVLGGMYPTHSYSAIGQVQPIK